MLNGDLKVKGYTNKRYKKVNLHLSLVPLIAELVSSQGCSIDACMSSDPFFEKKLASLSAAVL